MQIEQYDSVILKDGRRAAVVEKWDETHFLVDVGSSAKDWDTIDITIDDVEKVVKSDKHTK